MRNVSQASQCPGWHTSWALIEYKLEVLLLQPSCLANAGNDSIIIIFDKCLWLVHIEQRGLEGNTRAGKGEIPTIHGNSFNGFSIGVLEIM
jgi:hypothetical protein